jgi:ribonuclease BN (tRNA processing enzyme)
VYCTFLGTGAAMPLPDRHQTGLLLESEPDDGDGDGDGDGAADDDGRALLVDCGAGVLHRLAGTRVGYEGCASVLLTHHHLDHVNDLLALLKARWLAGEAHLEVVGPVGTKSLLDRLLGVHDYLADRVELRVREVAAGSPFEVAGFRVEGYETRHSMPCLAYRFDANGEGTGGPAPGTDARADDADPPALVFSGDSEAFDGLASFADGAAALVHDCSFPDDVDVSNHPTPTQLGAALAGHDYGRVYLSHLYPHTEGRHEEMIESVRAAHGGDPDVRVARDGLRFRVE